jgi:hypothetical protein
MSAWKPISISELPDLLKGIPAKTRLDVVQFALDLAGIADQSGVADATSGFISLLRGDLLGAAISAASILPLGDALKAAKFGRYATSMAELVSIALRNPKLAFALRTPLRQIRSLLDSITGFMGSSDLVAPVIRALDSIRASLDRYFARILYAEKYGMAKAALKSGRIVKSGQFVDDAIRGSKVTINQAVELLEKAATGSGPRGLRDGAEDLLGKMGLSDGWELTAGLHRSGSDATRHFNVRIDGIAEQFHIRVDNRGHIFDITHGKKGTSLTGH